MKRLFDPQLAANQLGEVEGHIAGTDEPRAKDRQAGVRCAGRGLRYTFQIKFNEPSRLSSMSWPIAVPASWREVVKNTGRHWFPPRGYRSVSSCGEARKRSSKMVFEANPKFREGAF